MSNARNQVASTIAGLHTHNEIQAAIKYAMNILAEKIREGDKFRRDFRTFASRAPFSHICREEHGSYQ